MLGQEARRTKCFQNEGVADHVQCCWEVKKTEDREDWQMVWISLGLGGLERDISLTRRGQHCTGVGGGDVMSACIHSFMKGLL